MGKKKKQEDAASSTSDESENDKKDQNGGDDDQDYETDHSFDNDEEGGEYIEKPVPFDEDEKSIGGVFRLGRFGIIFFIVALGAPFLFIFIIFGVIPIGDPTIYLFAANGAWVHSLIINPVVYGVTPSKFVRILTLHQLGIYRHRILGCSCVLWMCRGKASVQSLLSNHYIHLLYGDHCNGPACIGSRLL